MAVLDANMTAQLQQLLGNLREPIVLRASLDDSDKSKQTEELLREIEALHDKVSYERSDDNERRPSFEIARAGTDVGVHFAGLPMGHEFTSLVLALLQVGGHPVKISDEQAQQIRDIEGTFHFETYMSLTCQNCPDVVQALNAMSVLNPNIHHIAIEGGAFQDEIEARDIKAVPTVYLNGEVFGQGRMTVEDFISKLDTGADAKAAAKLSEKEPFGVLVIGGGPAGVAAAIYTARKGIRTGLVAERIGGQVLDTNAIENFISMPYTEGPKLAAALEAHLHEYEIDVMKAQKVASITDEDGLKKVVTETGAALRAKQVILATGARWRRMGVPGEEEYRNKGVTFCPHCDGPLFKGKRIAVIGGGNSGVEAAIDLAGIVGHVTLVEFMDEMRADEVLQRKLRSLPNVDIRLGTKTTEVVGDGGKVTGIVVEPRDGGEGETLALEGVFVQIGLLPNTEWLGDAVELSERGEIVIDGVGRTNLPGVFAAGDCTVEPYKQIVTALGAGSTASLSAFDHLIRTSAPSEEAAIAGTKAADGPLEAGDQIDVPDSVGARA